MRNRLGMLLFATACLWGAGPALATPATPADDNALALARQVRWTGKFDVEKRTEQVRATALAARGPDRLERLRRVVTETLVASNIPDTRRWMAIYERDIVTMRDARHARALAQLRVYERSLDGDLAGSAERLSGMLAAEDDLVLRASGRRLLAYILADADRRGHALEAIRLGLADARRVRDPAVRGALLLGLYDAGAFTGMKMDDYPAFRRNAAMTVALARTVEEPFDGGSVLYNLAKMSAAHGEGDQAVKIARLFDAYAAAAKDPPYWSLELCAEVSGAAGDFARSAHCAERALASAYIPPEHKHIAMMLRTKALARVGKAAAARASFEQLRRVVAERGDETLRERALELEAEVLRAEGRLLEAYDTRVRFHNLTMRSQTARVNAGVRELRENLEREVALSQARLEDARRVERLRTGIAFVALGALAVAAVLIAALWRSRRRLLAAREKAEEASRAKTAFLANMSHEIRTPLNGVLGVASALGKSDLSPEQRDMVGLIGSSARVLERLLSDVLDLAKVEAGKLVLEAAPYDLTAALAETADLFRPSCREKGIELTLEVEESLGGRWLGDEVRLRQVVSNLVSNAVKFTEAGSVTITASRGEAAAGPEASIAIADTGIGFDSDRVEEIFQRFEQADSTTTRRFGGTGLGLAISRSLAEAMGGTIAAISGSGEGSVFTLTLPLTPAPAEAAPEAPPEVQAGDFAGLQVLLADDHPVNHKVVELILAPVGVQLTVAVDGQAALDACRAQRFDLILMDMQMPVMDGLAATSAIRALEARESHSRTPIAMLTASASGRHRQSALAAGADDYIAKPIAAEALLLAVARLTSGGVHSMTSARAA